MLSLKTDIQPISSDLQEKVIDETNNLIDKAADYFQHSFDKIPVLFDLKGRA